MIFQQDTRRCPFAVPVLLLALALIAFSGCAAPRVPGQSGAKKEEPPKEPKRVENRMHQKQTLEHAYKLVVIEPVAITADMARLYPTVALRCQKQAIKRLSREKRRFTVARQMTQKDREQSALLVQSRITDIRLPSRTGGPGGARPESAHICLSVRLVDSRSGEVLQERELSTLADQSKTAAGQQLIQKQKRPESAQPDASKALGDIIARYVLAVMPLR